MKTTNKYSEQTLSENRFSHFVTVCVVILLMNVTSAQGAIGIYGVTTESMGEVVVERYDQGVDIVFVPPKHDLVEYFSSRGYSVFLTLNAFGGHARRKEYADAVPITAEGKEIDDSYGGICPTHAGWRKSRLELLEHWLHEFGGVNGISGVWLDFIRYPGRWERIHPNIPDTCYCDRCLKLFQVDEEITIPPELVLIKDKAAWINSHVPLGWVRWKKEQISSFVRNAREVLEQNSKGRTVKLGAFLVPWKKSDLNGALSFRLAQDAEQFEPYVDVFSPMVYHQMVGQTADWVGTVSTYYGRRLSGDTWPIIQAEHVLAEEFGEVVKSVSASGVEGLLVFKRDVMTADHFDKLAGFSPAENLFSNPSFEMPEMVEISDAGGVVNGSPLYWSAGAEGMIVDTRFLLGSPDESDIRSIGITGGNDLQGQWLSELPECEPGEKYRFSADFFRYDLMDSQAYPEVRVWGQSFRLNTHRISGTFQSLYADVACPNTSGKKDDLFVFSNTNPGITFWMRKPELLKRHDNYTVVQEPPDSQFFPIGVYGASSANLSQIRESGLNSAIVGLDRLSVAACLANNLHCTLAVPREPETLLALLNQLEPLIRKGTFSFYVNDEPGIHSFPSWKAADLQRIIKDRFPDNFTNMAIVRPQVIEEYQDGADYFMLDQYPVPNMPMTWLSDSMDEAAGYVGRYRLQAVIQAFGGSEYEYSGWPRLPTFAEMNCLAFLSVIHGSRGIYFYTYPIITSTAKSAEAFKRVIGRLNSLRSWLLLENDREPVKLRMTSKNRFDPQGRPAVHCAAKVQHDTRMLLCTNTISTSVKAAVQVPTASGREWQEYFSGEQQLVVNGAMNVRFDPFEVKVFLEDK